MLYCKIDWCYNCKNRPQYLLPCFQAPTPLQSAKSSDLNTQTTVGKLRMGTLLAMYWNRRQTTSKFYINCIFLSIGWFKVQKNAIMNSGTSGELGPFSQGTVVAKPAESWTCWPSSSLERARELYRGLQRCTVSFQTEHWTESTETWDNSICGEFSPHMRYDGAVWR